MWFSMVFGSGPLEGDFAEFPFAISAVSNPRVSKVLLVIFSLWPFHWPLCEFLTKTVTNLVGRHAHSSGRCPRVRLSRFAPAAEKTEKTEKRVHGFRSKPPRPKPQKFSGVAQPFFTKCPKLIPDHPQTLKSSDGPSSQPYRETRGYSRGMRLNRPDFLLLTWTPRTRADIGMNRDNAPSKGPTAENGVLNASHGLTVLTPSEPD